jgi:hemerythrin-like domain-containing protein
VEHLEILRLLRSLLMEVGEAGSKKDAAARLARLRSRVNRHFREEETILYRPLGAVLGRASPIGALIGEHRSIQSALEKVEASLTSRKARRTHPSDLRPLLGSLDNFVRAHIAREEKVLFWLAATMGADGDGAWISG